MQIVHSFIGVFVSQFLLSSNHSLSKVHHLLFYSFYASFFKTISSISFSNSVLHSGPGMCAKGGNMKADTDRTFHSIQDCSAQLLPSVKNYSASATNPDEF